MKIPSACLVIGAVAVNAIVLPRHDIRDVPSAKPKITLDTVPGLAVTPPQLYPSLFDSNGKLQAITGNGNFTAPKSLVADVQVEAPRVFKDGALRKKIRYGPFRLPGTKVLFKANIGLIANSNNTAGSQLAKQGNESFWNGRCIPSKTGKALQRMHDIRSQRRS
jgi:hypothetical protein